MKRLFKIVDGSGNVLRNKDNSLMLFQNPSQALKEIEKKGNSPYLKIKEFVR